MSGKKQLYEIVREMRNPKNENTYYAITLTANASGEAIVSSQMGFAGNSPEKPHYELKSACEVYPDKLLRLWADLKMPSVVVNDQADLYVFSIIGGNAIVEKSRCEEYFSCIFNEVTMVQTGLTTSTPFDEDFRRAPTPKLRMRILKRDNYHCRVFI